VRPSRKRKPVWGPDGQLGVTRAFTGGEPAIGPVRNGLENGLRTVGPGSLRTRRGARRERGGATGG